MFGSGISYQTDIMDTLERTQGSLERSVVDSTRGAGLAVLGADATLANVIVRDVRPQEHNDGLGDGIVLSSFLILQPDVFPTSLHALRATVSNSARAGLAAFGATVALGSSLFECNTIQLDGEPANGEPYEFEDLGDNECRCGDDAEPCTVLTSGLEPPGAF
jgi:hypothetical protein